MLQIQSHVIVGHLEPSLLPCIDYLRLLEQHFDYQFEGIKSTLVAKEWGPWGSDHIVLSQEAEGRQEVAPHYKT